MSDDDTHQFDLEDPTLPDWVDDNAIQSGGYPYDDKLKRKHYDKQLLDLQLELVKLQKHLGETGERVAMIFEGRDSAGKGGTIKRFMANLNPRTNKVVALPKPNEREQTQWYFQRYAHHLPAAGEMVLFDRSWYNRGGVERVMGFATEDQVHQFLQQAPRFEHMLVNDGIHLFKFWLEIGREMQLKRFHARRHDPLKVWKLSPIDLKALHKWDDYTKARNDLLTATDSVHAPWTVIRANDKRRARLNTIRCVLKSLDYKDRDFSNIGETDPKLVMSVAQYMAR